MITGRWFSRPGTLDKAGQGLLPVSRTAKSNHESVARERIVNGNDGDEVS
jgi:hypothetical protein